MRHFIIALVLAANAPFAAAAGFMPWTDVFARYDANGDGGVSMDEAKDRKLGESFVGFQPFMVDHFADLDVNADGKVTAEELKAMQQSKAWDDKQMVNQFYKNTGFMATNPENQ
ncbi:MAG: hypothetical protein IT493_03640 [Gammaproteobacteria bacterium]|nr:hypothetical protein [Gammaproteobacteria bacterium]